MKGYLFLDIDGTLVDSARTHEISKETMDALRKAKKNGYGCFICSGRNYGGLAQYTDIGMDGFVYADGAGIRIEGYEPVLTPIDEDLLKELEHLVIEELHGDMSMASDDHFYASEGQYALWTEYMKQMGNASFFERLYRMEDRGDTPILEIDLDLPDRETEEIFIRKMNPRLEYISTTASYGRGSRTAGEITMAGVTKGEGIRRAVAMLGGDMKDTYGFGDSMNDASMLKACAVGVCMGNGADELKQIADYVTDDINENGLANAFRKFGII